MKGDGSGLRSRSDLHARLCVGPFPAMSHDLLVTFFENSNDDEGMCVHRYIENLVTYKFTKTPQTHRKPILKDYH